MAVDECLFRSGREWPLLRLYEWKGDWVSLGYFHGLQEARELFGTGLNYVRRWTGGGIVDHRGDATYTLIMPRNERLAQSRGGESYCAIHQAVASCLEGAGVECSLTGNDSASDSKACFEKPVRWDIISGDGRKLAGAGQRRGREGVLHQGSVAVPAGQLAGLGQALARELDEVEIAAPENLSDLIGKYAAREWLERVP